MRMRVMAMIAALLGGLVLTASLAAFVSVRGQGTAAPESPAGPVQAAQRDLPPAPEHTGSLPAPSLLAPAPVALPVVPPATAPRMAAAPKAATAPEMAAAPKVAAAPETAVGTACPGNPNALGVSRVIEIDTTGGPGLGFEHFKAYDFLKPGEVVLTFDDGPWPGNTPAVLAALAAHCTKATFFSIGKHAIWHPEILKQVAEQGHTIGSHTWSHVNLVKKTSAEAKDEIEKGISAVHIALGGSYAPFFRFPELAHPPEMVAYLGERNIGIFSTDVDSLDFKIKKPELLVQSVMTKLKKTGKGIILMHDFQKVTAHALPEILKQLQANGYKVVQLKAKEPIKTLSDYDAMMAPEIKGATASPQQTSTVFRTISEVR